MPKLLVMGVSGCGKSTTAAALAAALSCPLIEGDDHHRPSNRDKMRRGIPLDDADRAPWLDRIGSLLAAAEGSIVVSCSALKKRYRDRLRTAEPALAIVYIDIGLDAAQRRVASRSSHFFPSSLVADQFAALESPVGEPGVARVDASWPVARQCASVVRWLDDFPS